MLSVGCETCLISNHAFKRFFFQLISEKLLENIPDNDQLQLQNQLNICKFLVCFVKKFKIFF